MRYKTECLPAVMRKLLSLILSSLPLHSGYADGLVDDSGLWTQLEGTVDLKQFDPKLDRFLIWTTGEARFFDDFGHLGQGIIRVVPGFRFNENITLFFGYTWNPNDLPNGRPFDEHDINQAFTWDFKPDWGDLSARTMVEWRFVSHDSQVAVRIRQKIRAKYPLTSIDPRLSLIGWEEAFINPYTVDWGPESGFDQNRAFAGFGWQLDPQAHFTLELGYMNQYVHLPNRDDLLNHMLFSGIQFKF